MAQQVTRALVCVIGFMMVINGMDAKRSRLLSVDDDGQGHGVESADAATISSGDTGVCSIIESYGYHCQDYKVVFFNVVLYIWFTHQEEIFDSSDRRSLSLCAEAFSSCTSRNVSHSLAGKVTTQDGYILSLHRIPGRGQPVLLQHGVLVDGLTWLLSGKDQSLPLTLANNGYDVWIANARGTRWSRGHTSLNPAQPEYWAWSWDELVKFDLPSTFKFVSQKTGQKLHYVGHSLGTLVALASFSEHELIDMLQSAALLSPIAYLSHMTTAVGLVAANTFLGEVTSWLGVAEFNPRSKPVGDFLKAICAQQGVDCYDLMTSFTGKNCCLNSSTVDAFLRNEPQSTSTKNLVHLAQTVRDGVVRMYDYSAKGKNENIRYYGQKDPPVYNLTNIPDDLPLFVTYGGKDALSDVSDVGMLMDSLKYHRGDKLTVHFINDYAHADFVMGVRAKVDVYEPLMTFFARQ